MSCKIFYTVPSLKNIAIQYIIDYEKIDEVLNPKEDWDVDNSHLFNTRMTVQEIWDYLEEVLSGVKTFTQIKKEMREGKIQIDTSSIPLTPEMVKAGVNFKTVQGLNKFTEMGYDMYFETIDDSGKSREVYPVILDKNTKAKYYLRDVNKNPIKRSIP